MANPWCPPLPTVGRAGPRITVLPGSTLLSKLEEYFCNHRSVSDVFERRISPSFQERCLRYRCGPRFLSEMTPAEQQSILLRNLYYKASAAFRGKLRARLDSGHLNHVRSWFHTANAAVFPLLLYHSTGEGPQLHAEVDMLVNWALENCAHQYANFQGSWKRLKKSMRKSYAIHGDLLHVECDPLVWPYLRTARAVLERNPEDSPAAIGRFVLAWCQTRATGMADHQMISQSLDKFCGTVSQVTTQIPLNPEVVRKVCRPALAVDGRSAKVSVGTTSCLESTRREGGKTHFVSYLATRRSLKGTYDFRTLEFTPCEPRPVRSAQDLVSWAVHVLLHNPTYTQCVRVHAVSEPSKARTITVAPYAYQVVMGVFAHLFQPSLMAKQIRSGLKADRHLWRFLTDVMNPQNVDWESLIDQNVYALSTDLSEATDFGNKSVARQIWQGLIIASENPEFPLGLALLAKTRFCGKRFCFVPDQLGNFKLVVANRGWFMGDLMTKVILTLSHQYCCELSGLRVYTLVGDDEIALDSDRHRLASHLANLGIFFQVSHLDTFISSRMAFYCEEGCLVPQRAVETPHVQMRRGVELNYLDYPRFRLLLPQISETDAYSMSNTGRFSLLGKETRWVMSSNPAAEHIFHIAQLLQHILVPQEPDCICPYAPMEIGGDGAFPHSARFMSQVVEDKSFNPREVKFRLQSMLNNRFSYKFVRSDRLDKVVNKHHLYLPKMEGMRALLPADSIIEPRDNLGKAMMRSLRSRLVATPQQVFFKLAKSCYYAALLQGRTPPEPVFSIDREFTKGHTNETTVNFELFRQVWLNPGFNFQDDWGYYIDIRRLALSDPMSLGWDWGTQRTMYPSSKEVFEMWLDKEVSLEDAHIDDILYGTVREGLPLPARVVSRLNLVLESDTYILSVLDRDLASRSQVAIITRDQRLAKLVRSTFDRWNPSLEHTVYAVDPAIYLTGRMDEVEHLLRPLNSGSAWNLPVIEDPGAMLHVDYTEFTDGFPHWEGIWDANVHIHPTSLCVLVTLVGD